MRKILRSIILVFMLIGAPVAVSSMLGNDYALLDSNGMQEVQISVSGSQLRIIGAAGQTVEIYNLTGVRVYMKHIDTGDQTFQLSLDRGCYIVKVGKTVRKVNLL